MNEVQIEVARQFSAILGYMTGTIFWIWVFKIIFGRE